MKIDLIMPIIQDKCKFGYLRPNERQTLSELAEQQRIDKAELDAVLTRELNKVRKEWLNNLFKAAKQPDAALSDKIMLFKQSGRRFPDMLRIGSLMMKINPHVTAPAFVPTKEMTGFCIIHNNQTEMACNMIQNVAMRLLLSLPRSLGCVNIVDPASMGADYIGLSGIDGKLLKVIDDEKQVQPFLQSLTRESAAFNFNELGNSFADIAEYNRTNRSKARPYQIVILADFQNIKDKNILSEIRKINNLAVKTGVFFLFDIDAQRLTKTSDLLEVFKNKNEDNTRLCIIDTVKKQVCAESNDEETFFNNAFDLMIDEELMFTAENILQLNHEFAPKDYPLEFVNDDYGDYAVESLNVVAGKIMNKDKPYKPYTISLEQSCDNILCVSQDEKKLETITVGMLNAMVSRYKRSELNYVFYNCSFIPEDLISENIVANIHTDKMQYLQSLLKHVSLMVGDRIKLFHDVNAANYEAYRNLVETPLPRIVCMIGGLDMILDSDGMSAVESVEMLDQLLNDAGKYGIHFILTGKPSANLLKINLNEHIRFKMFGSLNEEEVLRTGVFISEEELHHQKQPNNSLIYDGSNSGTVKTELVNVDSDSLKVVMNAFKNTDNPIVKPTAFVDLNDEYPKTYKGINAEILDDTYVSDDIPIGIPRCFDTQFVSLGHDNTMIVGNDPDGEYSLLRSVYVSMKRKGKLLNLIVLDVADSNPLGLPGMPGVNICHDVNRLSVSEGSIICILHAELFNNDTLSKLEAVIDELQKNHVQIVLFANNDMGSNGLGLIGTSFNTKIALRNAPDGFISPVHFLANDELKLPTAPLQAMCEQMDTQGNMVIKTMWLFNY